MGVTSFGVTQGSHIAFFDLSANEFVTFNGQEAPPSMVQAARARRFDRAKPQRPADDILDKALSDYNAKPAANCKGLSHLGGLSRTARYGTRAKAMKR